MLFSPTPLTEQETDVLLQIEEVKRRLGHTLQTPKVWYGLLRRTSLARAVRGSNSIEGFVVTIDDAIAAAEGHEPLDDSDEAWAAVRCYQEAMTYVIQMADGVHFSYSVDLIRSLHYMMMKYDLAKWPGRWRPGEIHVTDEESAEIVYNGPDHEVVPELMRDLAEYLNDADRSSPGIIRAAMAHLNLAMIHPFKDGNGRMARCLQTLVIARTGALAPAFSSIEEYLGRNTAAYYRVLAEVGGGSWHPENDTRPWVRFCITAHFRQATTLLWRAENMQRLWDALEEEIKSLGFSARTLLALADAATGLRVRNTTYRSAAEISGQMASRDLKLLTEAGLLIAQGEKRGRFYTASPRIQSLRERVWIRRQVPDPFAAAG